MGKTVVAAALAGALRKRGVDVGVMKPVATGCRRDNGALASEDAEALIRAAGVTDPMELVCPYRFELPVAPLVAAQPRYQVPKGGSVPGTRMAFGARCRTTGVLVSLDQIEQAYRELARRHEFVLVEGIGGLRVPLNGRDTVADLARRLGLPLLIVGRAGLGTINHTLLTLEAARSEGLPVAGLVLNGLSVRPSPAERTNPLVLRKLAGIPLWGVVPRLREPTPARVARHLKIGTGYKTGLRYLVPNRSSVPGTEPAFGARCRRLARIDRKRVWHPFTQMADWEKRDPLIVESGDGVYLTDVRGRRYLDGVSSLWVNLHGHRHPALDRALKEQAGKLAHSTLLGAANVPSIELADELVRIAPKGLARVFYSDNGSTAVEAALKMAFQYCRQNGSPKRRRFVHFVNAYHGDTIGSVSVGGIDLFHHVYGPLLYKGFKVPAPYPYRGISAEASLKALRGVLARRAKEIAAVVVEPLVQGAAGMIMQPKGWLKQVERLCRRHGVFLIADEVAVGFGRTGTMFACEQEGVRPDFLCLAKGLAGGYLPVAATLTTEKVYRGFLGPYASLRTFFHGHSYTGNPLGCAVALENLRLFRRERVLQKLQPKIRVFEKELARFRDLPHVGEVRQCGLMAGIELVADKKTGRTYPWERGMGIRVCESLRGRGILLRPLGNVIVLLPPLSISAEQIRFLCRETSAAIRAETEDAPFGDSPAERSVPRRSVL
ncbi:MAG: adenosylmethionine--8-amino-7-oxononanoate transaminase [Candidatus Omnitrophica bacterium]|nr:adenosylmethionine--8-amino-7-oxononanoate transaminase [Candidatus Omnitrophota bacterium]